MNTMSQLILRVIKGDHSGPRTEAYFDAGD